MLFFLWQIYTMHKMLHIISDNLHDMQHLFQLIVKDDGI